MVKEKLITQAEALARIEPPGRPGSCATSFDPKARRPERMAKGSTPRRRGRRKAVSMPTWLPLGRKGQKVVLVREETSPDDFHGMAVAQGI